MEASTRFTGVLLLFVGAAGCGLVLDVDPNVDGGGHRRGRGDTGAMDGSTVDGGASDASGFDAADGSTFDGSFWDSSRPDARSRPDGSATDAGVTDAIRPMDGSLLDAGGECSLGISTALGPALPETVSTVCGDVVTEFAMTSGGGRPYFQPTYEGTGEQILVFHAAHGGTGQLALDFGRRVRGIWLRFRYLSGGIVHEEILTVQIDGVRVTPSLTEGGAVTWLNGSEVMSRAANGVGRLDLGGGQRLNLSLRNVGGTDGQGIEVTELHWRL